MPIYSLTNGDDAIPGTPCDDTTGITFTVRDIGTAYQIAGGIGTANFTLNTPAPIVTSALTNDTSGGSHVTSDAALSGTAEPNSAVYLAIDGGAPPPWLAFDTATRTFSGTPPQDFHGPVALKVAASDGAFDASNIFTLIVNSVDDPPVVSGGGNLIHSTELGPAVAVAPAILLSDIDNTMLTGATASISAGFSGGGGWHFETTGDTNADHIFENDASHTHTVWQMNGLQITPVAQLGTVNYGADWHLLG